MNYENNTVWHHEMYLYACKHYFKCDILKWIVFKHVKSNIKFDTVKKEKQSQYILILVIHLDIDF